MRSEKIADLYQTIAISYAINSVAIVLLGVLLIMYYFYTRWW